jgi:hypothetical protein
MKVKQFGTDLNAGIRIRGKDYALTTDVLRVAVSRMIALAVPCGDEGFVGAVREVTAEARCLEGLAFMARTLRCETEAEMDATIHEEVERFGGGATGAREVYMSLECLGSWLDQFYGDLSRRFLCEQHRDISDAQDALSDVYAGAFSGTEAPDGEADAEAEALDQAMWDLTHTHSGTPPGLPDASRLFGSNPRKRETPEC